MERARGVKVLCEAAVEKIWRGRPRVRSRGQNEEPRTRLNARLRYFWGVEAARMNKAAWLVREDIEPYWIGGKELSISVGC
jgi:hypothetical protein